MKALREILERAARERSRRWALATLVRSVGSTYRQPGARMLIDTEGRSRGVLSGGCLEEEVARHARGAIQTRQPELLHFDTRLLYGYDGAVEILVEQIPAAGQTGNFLTAPWREAGTPATVLRSHMLWRWDARLRPAACERPLQ
ncbi:MAG: XdhC family protein [Verrucomicrobiota bacterium]